MYSQKIETMESTRVECVFIDEHKATDGMKESLSRLVDLLKCRLCNQVSHCIVFAYCSCVCSLKLFRRNYNLSFLINRRHLVRAHIHFVSVASMNIAAMLGCAPWKDVECQCQLSVAMGAPIGKLTRN